MAKSVYTKPVLDILKAAAEGDGTLPEKASADAVKTIEDMGLAGRGSLSESGRRVAAALKANGWRR